MPQHVLIVETASNDTTQRNLHFALAYLLGTTRLSFIRLMELEPSLYKLVNLYSAIPRNVIIACYIFKDFFLSICPWKRNMTPTLDAALLISSRAGADLGRASDSRV